MTHASMLAPLPATIRATVSPTTIDKVGRLFNGGPADVLAELLQNARRGGATRIDIDILDLAGHATLIVRDDGRGIDDPQALLTLGHSAWGTPTLANEDPAGMGVFAMAGLRVEYRSWPASRDRGWRVVIDPDAWSGSRPLGVEPWDEAVSGGSGTEVLIDLPEAWDAQIERAVAAATLHYPVPVFFRSMPCERRDWLADALHIERWHGCRIGVFHGSARTSQERVINFHGLTVPLHLPGIGEIGRGRVWTARVDIETMPELQLVLPARKEVVQTPFVETLKDACRSAIYRAIAKGGAHRLAFTDYLRGHDLGVPLPEADPWLETWRPSAREANERVTGEACRRPMILMPELEPPLAQTVARAVALGTAHDLPLVEAEPRFEGYGWYDGLDRVDTATILLRHAGQDHVVTGDPVDLPTGPAERIAVELTILPCETDDDIRNDGALDRNGDGDGDGDGDAHDRPKRIVTLPTDMALLSTEDWGTSLDEISVLVVPGADIEVPYLVELLRRAAFSPSDDRDSDSYETQADAFERDALQLARTLLLGADAGIIGRAIGRVEDHIRWLVPEGRTLLIAASREQVVATFQDEAPDGSDDLGFLAELETLLGDAPTDSNERGDLIAQLRAACSARRLRLLGPPAAPS